MRPTRHLFVIGVALAALALVGCTEEEEFLEIQPQTTTQNLEANLEANIEGLAEAMIFLEDSQLATDMFNIFPVGFGSPDQLVPDPSDPPVDPVPAPDEGQGPSFDMRPDARDLIAFLRDEIFNDANIEERSGTSITYRLPVALMCEQDTETYTPTGDIVIETTTDPNCVDMMTKVPVRFRVRSQSAGNLDIDVLISEKNHNPLHFELHQSRVAIEVDLGATRAAVVTVMQTLANGEPAELPEVMDGRVRLELVRNAPGDFSASFSVLEAVKVRYTIEGDTIAIDIAKAAPAASARLDANTRTVTLAIDWNAVDLSLPASTFGGTSMTCSADINGVESCFEESTGPTSGTFQIHLGGASGTTTFNAAAESMVFENLGLGDTTTTVAIDGKPLIGIDLNAAAGRRFGATVSSTGDGVRFEITPSFDLTVALTMQNLADQITDMASWTLNDVLQVTLDGAPTPTIIGRDTGLEVVAGTLTLSSAAATVSASAGQCLAEIVEDPLAEPTILHPFEELVAGVCQ